MTRLVQHTEYRGAASTDGVTLDIRTLHGIPRYEDEAARGLPEAIGTQKDAIAADGVVLATPEYSIGIPPVFKNADIAAVR